MKILKCFDLVCEECGNFNHGDCPIHGPLIPIEDADVDEICKSKARSSLPAGLEIRHSNIEGAGEGVFAVEEIKSGVRFGPYQGKKIHRSLVHDGRDTCYMWEVRSFLCLFNEYLRNLSRK